MNKQDLEWFIRDNLDYTFESANEEYPAEINIDYSGLAEKLQKEFYTAEAVREHSKIVAADAIKDFVSYFKKYARDDSLEQCGYDGTLDMEIIDNELDAAFEEYLKAKEK